MKSTSKAKMDISSPEYRNMVQNILGKKVSFEDIRVPLKNEGQNVIQTNINPQRVTGNKDVDTIVLKRLNDESLFSLLQVNKEYDSLPDIFFRERLEERYPFLVRYKPSEMSWKQYYLKNVHYIGKLKEEYDLDYVSFPGTSSKPEKIYKDLWRNICELKLYIKKRITIQEMTKEIINDMRLRFLIYGKKHKDILRILEKLDQTKIYGVAETVLKSGDLEFYTIIKKIYPFVERRREKVFEKKEAILKAIETEDITSLRHKLSEILNEIEKLDSYSRDVNYRELLATAVDSGEINTVIHIFSNVSQKDRRQYEQMAADYVIYSIIWDDPSIFDYFYNIVLSLKTNN